MTGHSTWDPIVIGGGQAASVRLKSPVRVIVLGLTR
jgi:hypothetical protein